jgi:ubiquinone/menaquinone biosynthesis C-methylase UbiE
MTDDANDRFARRMADILNHGALNLAMAIGYRTRLFDVMDRLDKPRTAAEIAAAAGLDARYVREWLAVMVTGEVVELTEEEDGVERYHLPAAHAAILTRRAGSANLGVYTQEMPLLTGIALEAVVERFSTGDGIPYASYPRFQQFMTELADAKHRQMLVSRFLPSVDDGRILAQLKTGIRVCDLGCGEGVALMLMAEAYPASRFTGVDICAESIAHAREAARRRRLTNVEWICCDAVRLGEDANMARRFDYITAFDAIHDQTRPLDALRSVHAMLRPAGGFSMVDIAANSRLAANREHPMGPFLYAVSLMHCMPVGLADGGMGLGMMWGRQRAAAMLREAGFSSVEVAAIPDDAFNLHFFCRKSPAV